MTPRTWPYGTTRRGMVCGSAYWGGLPRWWIVRGHGLTAEIGQTWQAAWMEYCSQKCCDGDPSIPPPLFK